MNALSIHPLAAPIAPLGLRPDLLAIEAVLMCLDDGHSSDPALNAAIYAALGWQVTTDHSGARRRLAWRCRSPFATSWERLPDPTGREDHAKRLVPYGWDYSAGVVDGHPRAWCRERRIRPGHDGPRFHEVNRLTPPRALTAAALFAVRAIAMEGY